MPLGRMLPFILSLWMLGWASDTQGNPLPVEIRGQLSVEILSVHHGEGTHRIEGRLSDETGKPVQGNISFRFVLGGEGLPVRPCADSSADSALPLLSTSSTGDFCGVLESKSETYVIDAEAPHFDSVKVNAPVVELSTLSAPRFSQAPDAIDLDHTQLSVVEILAGSGVNDQALPTELALHLTCRSERYRLGQSTLNGSRFARFEFSLPDVAPGLCQFIAIASAKGQSPAEQSREVLLKATVQLATDNIKENVQGTAIHIQATAHSYPVTGGVLEAQSDGQFLASVSLKNGRGLLILDHTPQLREVQVSYLSSSPEYVPGKDLPIFVPAQGPAHVRPSTTTLQLAGIAIFVIWLFYLWLRPSLARKKSDDLTAPHEAGVRPSPTTSGKIRGQVLDAHTGQPQSEVTLTLFSVQADGLRPLETETTDSGGHFQFQSMLESDLIFKVRCCSDLHMDLEAPVISARMTVFLSERRRTLLAHLIRWARRRGPPWDRYPAPTTGHVAQTAGTQDRTLELMWAKRIENLAYGAEVPLKEHVLALSDPATQPVGQGSETKPAD